MEKYIFDLIAFLIGTALVGMVALLINGLKNEILELKKKIDSIFDKMVTEKICGERREGMKKDIDNIAEMVRGR